MAPAPDKSWYNAPRLMQIAASQQGGSRGAQVWGVTDGYGLISIYQEAPGGTWSGWSGPGWENAPGFHVDPPPQSSLIRNEKDVGGRVKPGHGACAIGGEYAE